MTSLSAFLPAATLAVELTLRWRRWRVSSPEGVPD
jgi:hypothetical protein